LPDRLRAVRQEAAPELPRDLQVITAVLKDLLTYTGEDSPVLERGLLPDQILLAVRKAVADLVAQVDR
jgi:hypothetical protein